MFRHLIKLGPLKFLQPRMPRVQALSQTTFPALVRQPLAPVRPQSTLGSPQIMPVGSKSPYHYSPSLLVRAFHSESKFSAADKLGNQRLVANDKKLTIEAFKFNNEEVGQLCRYIRNNKEQFIFFKSIASKKEKQAKSNITNLQNWDLLKDEKLLVLDIGSGIGLNAQAMQKAGATVIAVEPDSTACVFATKNGYIAKENLYNCLVEKLPIELNGKFDLITIFLFNIPVQSHDVVFKRVSELLKPNGKLVIGTEVEEYTAFSFNNPNNVSLRPILEKYFGEVTRYNSPDSNNKNKYVLVCNTVKRNDLKAAPTPHK